MVLAIFVVIDIWHYRKDRLVTTVGETKPPTKLAVSGSINFLLIAAIVGAILASATWRPGISFDLYGTRVELQNMARDAALLLIVALSLALTPNEHREANDFTWEPIREVAILFAGIYVRGMLAEDHGVDLAKIEWLQAGVNEPGRAEKVELKLPAGIRYKARADTSLSAMLASGEVDAIISARAPEAFAPGGAVVRLFPDYRAEEERFYKKTGIFPIMHLVTMRRAAYEQHPWIAMNLYKMFDEAKRRCLARLRDFTCARIPLPWAAAIADEIAAGYGPDPYPYGIEESRATLEAFCRYAHDQGVTHRRMTIDDLFPREVRAMARV